MEKTGRKDRLKADAPLDTFGRWDMILIRESTDGSTITGCKSRE